MDFLSEAGRTTYVSRPTTAGLKSCERWQLNQGAVKAPSFVSVDQSTLDKQNIVITKGDVLIEFPFQKLKEQDIGFYTKDRLKNGLCFLKIVQS